MSINEFSLIQKYFNLSSLSTTGCKVGIGDDAAICDVPQNHQLVTTVDTLIAGVHFPINTSPEDIAYKAGAVNVSDLAAMGATAKWMTLALTCPSADEKWLAKFSQSLFEFSKLYNITLIGGDTTRGSLSITIQMMGLVPTNQAILRSGAKIGDKIYVTGTLGDAGLGLKILKNKLPKNNYLIKRLNRPTPRLEIGINLCGIANSAIDISDGLLADLGHILQASNKGANLQLDKLPFSLELLSLIERKEAIKLALTAGDDYELCFTISPKNIKYLQNINCTCIGKIEEQIGIRGLNNSFISDGFKHFS
jgi:thiamine-monophosphate kinase